MFERVNQATITESEREMKGLLIACALIALTGCNESLKTDAGRALVSHQCSKEQFKRVESEALFCDSNTEYQGAYCFGSAIIRICTLRQQPNQAIGERNGNN